MADGNPEETFTFVDKRKVGGEQAGAEASGDAAKPEPLGEDEDGGVVEFGGLESDEDADTDGDPFGSFGMAAYITGLMAQDAWQKMGLIADPTTGKLQVDLNQARFSIDCVSALIGVISAHEEEVPAELRRDLQRVLNDLRLNFVEKSRT